MTDIIPIPREPLEGTSLIRAYNTVRSKRGSFLRNPFPRHTPKWYAWRDRYMDELIAEIKKNPPRLR